MSNPPVAGFNHMALSVPDAQAAVDWYTKVFDLEVLVPVMLIEEPREPKSKSLTNIYGDDMKATKLAVLLFGNDVALEIFEFVSPPYCGPSERVDWSVKTYTSGGQFHFCLTVSDVDAMIEKAVSAGGKQVGDYISSVPEHKAAYVQDPWGNVIELANMTLKDLFMKVMQSS